MSKLFPCLVVSFVALAVGLPAAHAQEPPPSQPSLGEAVRDWWRKVPDPVKAKAKEKLMEIIEMSFAGARPVPPPPPPVEAKQMTNKEKQAAEKARKAELAKLKKLERERKAAEAKRQREEAARAAKEAKAAKAAAAKAGTTAGKEPVPATPVAAAPPATTTLSEVSAPLERRGSSYYVGARLNEQHDVSFLYDTGASLTTIDAATAQRLGVAVSPDAPKIRTQTANGVVEQPLLVIDTIDVGGARVGGGFTVGLCEACSDGRKIGLLGLNFSRRYLVTLDESSRKLRLTPRADLLDHRFDIEPFLVYEGVRGQVRGGEFHVSGTVRNRAPRACQNVRVVSLLVDKQEKEVGRVSGHVGAVPAGGTTSFTMHGRAKSFDKFYLELDGADW